MTSNVGSDVLRKGDIGFGATTPQKTKSPNKEKDNFKKRIQSILKDSFRPEFLNRIDEIVVFENLTKQDIEKIVVLLLKKTQKLLDEHKITLNVDNKTIKYLVKTGYSEEYGARPLRRLIQKEIENVISSKLIAGEIVEDDSVSVSASKQGVEVTAQAKVKAKA